MSHLVDILLATNNGEKYLPEQMESLLGQTFCGWRLIVRDDGSDDQTLSILHSYQKKHPDQIRILADSLGHLGPAGSFSYLVNESTAPYIAFCDQDDVWMQEKLYLQMEKMKDAESKYGAGMPILIHSDLYVIENDGTLLDNSFWHYQNINPFVMNKFRRILMQNFITGCTMLMNRPLFEISMPLQAEAIMHDWWIAVFAISEGKVISLNNKTVKYRQHESNDVGAKKWNLFYNFRSILIDPKKFRSSLQKTRDQASALLETRKLNNCSETILEKYIQMYSLNGLSRRVCMIRIGFFKFGLLRNLATLILI